MNKWTKQVATIALGTTILFSATANASAATYTVQKGDTLSAIAKKNGTTYTAIMKENNLKTTALKIGQKLNIGGASSITTTATNTVKQAVASTYTVKKGDTLSKIAKAHNTTYQQLMTLNGLKTTALKIGQALKVSGTAVQTASAATSTSAGTVTTKVITIAQSLIGSKYVAGGATKAGFDCSGFVYYVMKNAGKSVSRTSAAGYYNQSIKVSTPQVGDLVFFSNTYKKGISHVGIYIGNGKMIGASGDSVKIASVSSPYWKSHFTGYGRM